MATHKTLIDKAYNDLTPKGYEEKFYRFAQSYITKLIAEGITDNKLFFDTIKSVKKGNSNTIKMAFGISGSDIQKLEEWCNNIITYKEKLDIIELNYLMGYCARIAKYEDFVWKKNNQSSKAGNNYNNRSKQGSGGRRNGKR